MPSLSVPYIEYGQIWKRAAEFLRAHGVAETVPVPILDIIELQMRVNIIPLPGLKRDVDIDAFISSDCGTITVDEAELFSANQHRLRFSLAHEIAHLVLHRDVLSSCRFRTIAAYKTFLQQVPDKDLIRLETQANHFAGLVLVPRPALAQRLKLAVELARQAGIPLERHQDEALPYICGYLAADFDVSDEVISRRITLDRLLTRRIGRS